jgi:hypothetical protein
MIILPFLRVGKIDSFEVLEHNMPCMKDVISLKIGNKPYAGLCISLNNA